MVQRVSEALLKRLDLAGAAQTAVGDTLLEFPHLISDQALSGDAGRLAAATRAEIAGAAPPSVEIVAMPKQGYGLRPIAVTSPQVRVLYTAITDALGDALPSASRDIGIDAHLRFGLDDARHASTTIVDLDIAACYEYIDHKILAEELLAQSLDPDGVAALEALLRSFYPRGVGLPQAMPPSHRLADAYLDQMSRALTRDGYEVHRYVDDFRLVLDDRHSGQTAIEQASEHARRLGLVLAGEKVRIRTVGDLRDSQRERDSVFVQYERRAKDALQVEELVYDKYDNFRIRKRPATGKEVDFAALAQIVEDWALGGPEVRKGASSVGRLALSRLSPDSPRLADSTLESIVRREAVRLVEIVTYLRSRAEPAENWATLASLTRLDRLSAWSRLWLLATASALEVPDDSSHAVDEVTEWAAGALEDPVETVRAEAAWFLARHDILATGQAIILFAQATGITRHGLAATAGLLSDSKGVQAMRNASALTKTAFEWGRKQR